MDKYKANRNNEEVIENSKSESKEEATSKALDTVATAGLDIYTRGTFSKVKNGISRIPGIGKIANENWNKNINKISNVVSKTPLGNIAQGLNDSGVTDTVKTGYDAVSNVKNGQVSGNNESNLNGLFSEKNNSKNNSTASNFMSKIKISKSMKIKIIVGIIIVAFFILMICVVVAAAKDLYNLDLTNDPSLTGILSSKGKKCSSSDIENRLIYVGDSRTVELKNYYTNENITYIAEVSMGHDWLVNTATSLLDNELQNKSNAVVVLALGANDLFNIDNYISTYKGLIEKYPSIKFYVLSVNPVDEAIAANNGYTLKNSDIESFNNKLKENFSEQYIDTYSELSEFNTNDGIHYDSDTSIKIHNLTVSKLSNALGPICSNGGNLIEKLEEIGKWYIENVNTYTCSTTGSFQNCRKKYKNPFTNREYGDDCTEFVSAYMSYVCGGDISESYSGEMVYPDGTWAKSVAECGWKAYTSDEIDSLQAGDVLIAHSGFLYSTKGQHGEVYIDESHTFGWGSIKKSYPTNNTITKKEYGGHVHYEDNSHDYITIYRYEG